MQLPGPSPLNIQLGTCYSIAFKIKAPLQALETQGILPLKQKSLKHLSLKIPYSFQFSLS